MRYRSAAVYFSFPFSSSAIFRAQTYRRERAAMRSATRPYLIHCATTTLRRFPARSFRDEKSLQAPTMQDMKKMLPEKVFLPKIFPESPRITSSLTYQCRSQREILFHIIYLDGGTRKS